MYRSNIRKTFVSLIFLLSLLFIFGGCSVDISESIPKSAYYDTSFSVLFEKARAPEEEPSADNVITLSDKKETETTPPETEAPEKTETTASTPAIDLSAYPSEFPADYNAFLSRCVFVGDSICRGLAAYEIIPSDHVVAQGNIAARNIFDFTFKVGGEEMSLLPALVNLKPEYIVFSMGMNDVNMTSQQEFCDNYGELLTLTESFLPEAKLIVFSVTPVLDSSNFTANTNIDSFNDALKAYLDASGKWTYVDISSALKGSDNGLKGEYESGDGIHLSPAAYNVILYTFCADHFSRAE